MTKTQEYRTDRKYKPKKDLNQKRVTTIILFLSFLLFNAPQIGAQIRMSKLFGDNMVLQQNCKVNIWGTGTPGEDVSVNIGGAGFSGKTNPSGKWLIAIDPPPAGGPYQLTVKGENTISFQNVRVGEVWICSGQSNMEWPLSKTLDGKNVVAGADYPDIHLFKVAPQTALTPQEHLEGGWAVCTPKSVADFSGVAFYFGRYLTNELKVPIGLIESAWGGPPVEAWTSTAAISNHLELYAPLNALWETLIEEYPPKKTAYLRRIRKWRKRTRRAVAQGKRPPRKPKTPLGPNDPSRPSNLFNGMIAPLIPYTIAGVVWYQGEANATRGYQYRRLFPLMIEDWRTKWPQGNFPFLFVQLPFYKAHKPDPVESFWAELREAQAMALKLPRTGMVVTIDVGDEKSMHPKDKTTVGKRLSLAAQAIAYNKDVVYRGPMLRSYEITSGQVILTFDHVGSGFVIKGAAEPEGFAIAGENRQFVWAEAKIQNDLSIVVRHPTIPEPKAVRYGWQKNPQCNLYNSAGLPAAPFRTDDWPGLSIDNELPVWIKGK